jgi:hypothetical protein
MFLTSVRRKLGFISNIADRGSTSLAAGRHQFAMLRVQSIIMVPSTIVRPRPRFKWLLAYRMQSGRRGVAAST